MSFIKSSTLLTTTAGKTDYRKKAQILTFQSQTCRKVDLQAS